MSPKRADFYPFYDPYRGGSPMGCGTKLAISLAFGCGYMLLQFLATPDKAVFVAQASWLLGIIITVLILAMYLATQAFRNSLVVIQEFEGNTGISEQVIHVWLSTRNFTIAGATWAAVNTTVGHLLGVPAEFHAGTFSLIMIYTGFIVSGFAAGMGLLAISSVIVLYQRFAPQLEYSLDPNDPDAADRIKILDDSLWTFGMLIGAVGVLVTAYLISVEWAFMYREYVRTLFITWVALPYLMAISIVLIPGLAVRRQVNFYKG